jgi:hypothetical protein
MLRLSKLQFVISLLTFGILVCASGPTAAAVRIEGLVQAGGGPLANSVVTLWAASAGQPRQLGQASTNSDGQFEVGSQEALSGDTILYLIAKGGTPAVNKGSSDNPAISKNQLVHFPKGDLTKGRIVCEGRDVEPCRSFMAPFHLGIDQQDRIWVTNAAGDHVTRFPTSDPSKAEKFSTGWSGSCLVATMS